MNYERIYNQIIQKAKDENRKKVKGGVYYEGHHIIPKCMGGEGSAKDIEHPNIVLLTAKEHYICHRLLVLIYPDNNKLRFAMWCMINGLSSSNKRYIPSSRIYARLKEEHNKIRISDEIRKKISDQAKRRPPMSDKTKKKISNSSKGRWHSDEAKKKISEAKKGRKLSDEHKKKLSDINKARPLITDDTRKKISDKAKGRLVSTETKRKISEANKGHIHSADTKKKMSDSWKLRLSRTNKL